MGTWSTLKVCFGPNLPKVAQCSAGSEEQHQRMHLSCAKLQVNQIDADIEVALKKRQLRLAMLD
jgi:hypothetical protein